VTQALPVEQRQDQPTCHRRKGQATLAKLIRGRNDLNVLITYDSKIDWVRSQLFGTKWEFATGALVH
jgi:hypothetical protein